MRVPQRASSDPALGGAAPLHIDHEWNGWFKNGNLLNGFNDGVVSHVIQDIFPSEATRNQALQNSIDLIRVRESSGLGQGAGLGATPK